MLDSTPIRNTPVTSLVSHGCDSEPDQFCCITVTSVKKTGPARFTNLLIDDSKSNGDNLSANYHHAFLRILKFRVCQSSQTSMSGPEPEPDFNGSGASFSMKDDLKFMLLIPGCPELHFAPTTNWRSNVVDPIWNKRDQVRNRPEPDWRSSVRLVKSQQLPARLGSHDQWKTPAAMLADLDFHCPRRNSKAGRADPIKSTILGSLQNKTLHVLL